VCAEDIVEPFLFRAEFSLAPATCRPSRSRQKARLASVSATTIAV
jgi:hypothetical protein